MLGMVVLMDWHLGLMMDMRWFLVMDSLMVLMFELPWPHMDEQLEYNDGTLPDFSEVGRDVNAVDIRSVGNLVDTLVVG